MGWTLAGPQGEGSCGQCSLWLSCLIPAASPSHCTLTLEEVRDPTGRAGRQAGKNCLCPLFCPQLSCPQQLPAPPAPCLRAPCSSWLF